MSLLMVIISFITFIFINYFGSLALEMFLLSFMQGSENIVSFYQIGRMIITCFLAFPAFLAINKASFSKVKMLFAGKRNIKAPLVLCITFILLVAAIVPVVIAHSFMPDMTISFPDIPTGIWLLLITPVIEEIMFRGVILQKVKNYGAIPAVLISTILFSVGHLNFGNMLVSFLPGIVLAIVAIKTESIRYTVPMHMLVNLAGNVILPLALS